MIKARSCGRRGFSPILPIALSIIYLAVGCSRQEPPRPEVVRPVKTMVVIAGDETHVRSFPGRVEASKSVELAFQVPGLLVRLPVKEGQNVAKDDLIAQLRQDEFQARLQAVQGQLDQARAALSALRQGERPEERTAAGSAGAGGRGEARERPDGIRAPRAADAVECRLARGLRARRNRLPRGPGRPQGSPPDPREGNDCPRGGHRGPGGRGSRVSKAAWSKPTSSLRIPRCAPPTTA